jgi:NTE family protein
VIRPILRHQSARTLLRSLAEFAGVPVVRLESFLGAPALRRTVSDWLDWEPGRANLEARRLDALAVVATSARTERAVVFAQAREDTPVPDATLVDYVREPLDGGTRLNMPIKPVLDLGVDRVVVVATHAPLPSPRA